MSTRRHPTTSPHSGDDLRISLRDVTHEFRDSFACFEGMVTKGGFDMSSNPRECEVQAFRPGTSGLALAIDPVVIIRLASATGEAMLMCSKGEAQEIALALLSAVYDAGKLEVAAYLEAHRSPDEAEPASPAHL
jgi:hypothetical protein